MKTTINKLLFLLCLLPLTAWPQAKPVMADGGTIVAPKTTIVFPFTIEPTDINASGDITGASITSALHASTSTLTLRAGAGDQTMNILANDIAITAAGGVYVSSSIELSHATQNTLTASGGVLSIEGKAVLDQTNTVTGITNKTFVAPALGNATGTGLVLTIGTSTGTTTSSGMVITGNSLTTGTGMYISSSSLTSGKLLDLAMTGNGPSSGSPSVLNIALTGANTTNAITTIGGTISNTRTNATSGTNIGLIVTARGATTANQAIVLGDGNAATETIASNLSGATDPTITFGNATIDFSSAITSGGNISTGNTSLQNNGNLKLLGRGFIIPSADGTWILTNNATTGWTQLIRGASGGLTSISELQKLVSSIADNTATDVLTVTVPNAAHAATLRVTLLGRLGAGGAIGADEASGTISYDIAIARTAGVATVATVSTAYGSATSSVAGAATITVTAGVSGMTGLVSAQQTFTVQVTIAHGSGSSANHKCTLFANLINANATGITIQ